jgi:hypothetical protein
MNMTSNKHTNQRINNHGIRMGFKNKDVLELNRLTNNNPKIQIFDPVTASIILSAFLSLE